MTDQKKIGKLEQHSPTEFVFTYLPNIPKKYALSLTMPPREEPYASSFLFPVFQVYLPEGFLRHKIERHLAQIDKPFDDIGILAVVGESLIGGVKVVPCDIAPQFAKTLLPVSLDLLLTGEMPKNIEKSSGVSGGFPKFLASSHSGDGIRATHTYAMEDWIVKLNDSDHANIVALEYFGMMAAQKMGLPVPEIQVAQDYSRILVKRFDIDSNGNSIGFEDICALMGMPSREKFNGSVEKIIKTIKEFCNEGDILRSCEQFYAQYLLAIAIRNGDAHLKNFGLLYGLNHSPTLAPVYDMLSMAVYAPPNSWRDADDGMALTLGGTRRWPSAKALVYLGDLCGVSIEKQQYWKSRLISTLLETSEIVCNNVWDHDIVMCLSRMLELWEHGMREIDAETSDILKYRTELLSPTSEKKSTPTDLSMFY